MKNEQVKRARFVKDVVNQERNERDDEISNKLEKWKSFADRNLEAEKDWKFLKEENLTSNELAKEMLEVDNEVRKYLKKIADQYKPHKVILRSILSGVFTAFGATIVFAILLFLLSSLYSNITELPVVGEFVQDLHIEVFLPDRVDSSLNSGADDMQ